MLEVNAMDYGLNKEALFHLNDEFDRIDIALYDAFADEDMPLGELIDAGDIEDA